MANTYREMPKKIRGFKAQRCPDCWMLADYCVCELLPRLENRLEVVLVMQWKESGRSSNTGRLVTRVLDRSRVMLRGRKGHPFDGSGLRPAGTEGLLLYPGEDAEELAPGMLDDPGRALLVVPDGSWRWSQRLWRHEPALAGLRRVRLPAGPPSIYRLRREPTGGHLCTYEAVARALGLLEAEELGRAMMRPFAEVVRRTLKARGRLKKDGSPAAG